MAVWIIFHLDLQIWDLSDPTGKGFLNKQGFFVALKLVSLAQGGRPTTMDSVVFDMPAPKMVCNWILSNQVYILFQLAVFTLAISSVSGRLEG